MTCPLHITFRGMEASPSVEEAVKNRLEKLSTLYDRLMSCNVVVEEPHRHHTKGRRFKVLVDVTIPGAELVAGRHQAENNSSEDVYVAIRDAFRAVRRELEDHLGRTESSRRKHPPAADLLTRLP